MLGEYYFRENIVGDNICWVVKLDNKPIAR